MSLLPYLNNERELADGTLFHLLPFCKANCKRGKCKEFYESLEKSKMGSYCCPYGLSSLIYEAPTGKTIYSGLKIKGVYDKKKAKVTSSDCIIYNPVVDEKNCFSIAKEMSVSLAEKEALESKLEAIRDLLHETRSLNGQVKNLIDSLWEQSADEEQIDYMTMLETLKSAHVSSFMISNRFAYFDSVLNPLLSVGEPYPAVVFKKFDKMRKLLKGYLRKNVWISITSQTISEYRYKIYPTFETLLFILLENAIKYSPKDRPIDVSFNETDSILDVSIKSIGPYCDDNEIAHLCEKGFRGENAVISKATGQGFGLNFAKKICSEHGIEITFNSVYAFKDHGIKYGTFCVNLHFNNKDAS